MNFWNYFYCDLYYMSCPFMSDPIMLYIVLMFSIMLEASPDCMREANSCKSDMFNELITCSDMVCMFKSLMLMFPLSIWFTIE